MDKKNAIKTLKECLKIEELVIPLYSKHINSTLFLSGFEKGKADKIERILNTLREDSLRHKAIFDNLINEINTSEKNVY